MVAPTRADEPHRAIEDGRVALARGAWAEARVRFAEALAQEETPEAFEGAGLAARYELDAEAAIEAHERGYRLARSRGDAATAARLAIQLCYDAYAFRGPAEASGWVERAALLVEGQPPSVATAWVSLIRAQFALADHHPDVGAGGVGARDRARARGGSGRRRDARALAQRPRSGQHRRDRGWDAAAGRRRGRRGRWRDDRCGLDRDGVLPHDRCLQAGPRPRAGDRVVPARARHRDTVRGPSDVLDLPHGLRGRAALARRLGARRGGAHGGDRGARRVAAGA